MGAAEKSWVAKDHWGLGRWGVGETRTDPTAKAPPLSDLCVTLLGSGATLGRRGEPNNDRREMHWGLKVALKEIQSKLHLVLT